MTRVLMTLAVLTATATAADDWSQWGGPTRDFQVRTGGLAARWPEGGPPKLWSRPLGAGYSAITFRDGQLYTLYRDGEQDVVVALDAKTGATRWETRYTAPLAEGQTSQFGQGPNATPLVLEDRLITVSFTGQVHCLSRKDGKVLWRVDLVSAHGYTPQEFGYSASPLLHDGKVILLAGGSAHGVIALNPQDGALAWGGAPHGISYASPVLINVDGQDQLVVMSSDEVLGLSADGGRILWRHGCVNRYRNNATDPIWSPKDGLLWVATQLDGGARVLKLSRSGDKTEATEAWFDRKVQIFHWNAVLVDGTVYGSIGGQQTFLSAVDLETGAVRWKQRGFHKALCVHADGKLIFLDENGVLALALVSPERCEVLSRVALTEKPSWTVPTLVGPTLFVRDGKTIMALDLGE